MFSTNFYFVIRFREPKTRAVMDAAVCRQYAQQAQKHKQYKIAQTYFHLATQALAETRAIQ